VGISTCGLVLFRFEGPLGCYLEIHLCIKYMLLLLSVFYWKNCLPSFLHLFVDFWMLHAVYKFEENLSNHERAVVHVLCRKMGMTSKSTG